jgi:hypothetical protein
MTGRFFVLMIAASLLMWWAILAGMFYVVAKLIS